MFDPETDAAIPLRLAVLCLDCETIRHLRRLGGRCPCGASADMPLERVAVSIMREDGAAVPREEATA